MREKITYLEGAGRDKRIRRRPHPAWAYSDGDYMKPEDADLEEALADIIVYWRGVFATEKPSRRRSLRPVKRPLHKGTEKPSAQDIKATLLAMRALDDNEIIQALRALDPWTTAHLWRLAEKPTAEEIRRAARDALRKMKHVPSRPGRSTVRMNYVWFGVDLARWWQSHKGKQPTITANNGYTTKESEFLTWATSMFQRAGRQVTADALVKPLRQACKIINPLKTRA